MSVQTVVMKCDNTECGETWRTGNIEFPDHSHEIIDPNCDKCGSSGFIEQFIKENKEASHE